MSDYRDFFGRPAPDALQPYLLVLDCSDVMKLAGMYGEARDLGDTDLMAAINQRMGKVLHEQGWPVLTSLRQEIASLATQPLTAAANDVLAERRRQVEAEGWTPEHDDEHANHEMAHAAACYAYPELTALVGVRTWPWTPEWLKVRGHRANYVRAAALLLAEIERLDRMEAFHTAQLPSHDPVSTQESKS